ncbi:hypothetical protein SAMN05443572_1011286 [Myxococcus fulvus]|uniref:Uncharacterized protein n=1 Tax=Myxococcus fulvus TaxID=33 RepID=A0A511STC2_MYXFU|nr:hypothetical protein [Myxococcus fulvus]GEN05169.1 hypothetical protein MFU01_02060 [Myxococcus fulvus]SET16107.1 hypothetical protein SAMN05443572_1011286 [Myxococcus fulvus]
MRASRPVITESNAARLTPVARLGPSLPDLFACGQRLAFDPTGTRLSALARRGNPLRWWDLEMLSPEPMWNHASASGMHSLVFPDAEHVLTVVSANRSPLGLWRPRLVAFCAKDGAQARERHLTHAVTRLAMSADGARLLLVPLEGDSPEVWDLKSWRPLRELTPMDLGVSVTACALSPEGRFAAVTFHADDRRGENLWLWDVASEARPVTLSIDAPTVWSLAFHPTQPLLAVGGITEEVAVVHVGERRQVRSLSGFHGYACNLSFNPDGTLLAASRDGRGFGVHRFDTGEALFHHGDGEDLHTSDAVFSPDGRLVAWGRADGTVELWGVAD